MSQLGPANPSKPCSEGCRLEDALVSMLGLSASGFTALDLSLADSWGLASKLTWGLLHGAYVDVGLSVQTGS